MNEYINPFLSQEELQHGATVAYYSGRAMKFNVNNETSSTTVLEEEVMYQCQFASLSNGNNLTLPDLQCKLIARNQLYQVARTDISRWLNSLKMLAVTKIFLLFADIGCPYPIMPPEELNLEPKFHNMSEEAPIIEFGQEVQYGCKNGMKFEKDFHLETENATCRENNTWDEPNGAWSKCVSSKQKAV